MLTFIVYFSDKAYEVMSGSYMTLYVIKINKPHVVYISKLALHNDAYNNVTKS